MLLVFIGFFGLISIICFVYTILIIAYSGPGTAFLWFWPFMGIMGLLAAGLFLLLYLKNIHLPKILYYGFTSAVLLVAAVFFYTEGRIIFAGNDKAPAEGEYVIVLGAQVKGRTVSRALKSRLDTAYEYLKNNPGATAIVSGGQGRGEDITEASAMKSYLIGKGISKERILSEDKSVNTYQNLIYCKEIIKEREVYKEALTGESKVIIVTSRFHVFRALRLAKTQKFKTVYGLGAPNGDMLTLHYYVREFFGVVKDIAAGNIKLSCW